MLHNGHLWSARMSACSRAATTPAAPTRRWAAAYRRRRSARCASSPATPTCWSRRPYGRGVYTYRFGTDAGRCAVAAGTQKPGAAPCAKSAGFKRAKVTPRGHGLRFTVSRLIKKPFSVDVFRDSRGRRVLNNHRVLHLTKRTRSLTWKGRGPKVGDGYYFARLILAGGGQRDTRRFTLVRSHGRFHLRPPHYAKDSCTLIRSAKLSSPAWGGTRHVRLGVAVRLTRKGSVKITIKRGKKLVKRFTIKQAGTKTRRVYLKAGRLPRGDYRVTIAATAASLHQHSTLRSRKL